MLDRTNIVLLAGTAILLVVLPRAFAGSLALLRQCRGGNLALAMAITAMAIWYVQLPLVSRPTRSVVRAQNGLVVLATSLIARPALDIMAVPPLALLHAPLLPVVPVGAGPPVSGVVVIVLESIGADPGYGESPIKQAGLMPTLTGLAQRGVRFDNIYTPIPASTAAGVHLMSGRYVGYPAARDLALATRDTLPARLHRHGWRTALFMSGDLAFQGLGDYLRPRGFDHLEDRTALGCRTRKTIDDGCTAAAFRRWLDGTPSKPYFAVLWTGQAHYPYYGSEASSRTDLLRYQQAVQAADLMIGSVLETLQRRGSLDSTIFVVMGDHGEAFDEHGFELHANSTYREETRVPLVIAGPGLPHVQLRRTGSTLDIGTTLLSLIGRNETRLGRGVNLLAAQPLRPAFSYVLGPVPMLGYRNGEQSTLLSLETGEVRRYDLGRDPFEQQPEQLAGVKRSEALRMFAALVRQAKSDGVTR